MKNLILKIAAGLVLLAGVGMLLYPTVSNLLMQRTQTQLIDIYEDAIAEKPNTQIEQQRRDAQQYNDGLSGNTVLRDPFLPDSGIVRPEGNYADLLNIGGVMGYLRVPAIQVSLVIYHGTTETVLENGAGHLEGSSLPIGGPGTHTVITGHSGLPSAKFLTELEKMKHGDLFYLHVLDEVLAYEVDQILVVEPDDTDDLRIVRGRDYATLITCTPYAVNSHRLLVRGHRVPYIVENDMAALVSGSSMRIIILAVLILLLSGMLLVFFRRRKRKRSANPAK